MNIVKGLKGGLFHLAVCHSDERKRNFTILKQFIDDGSLIRDIQPAPRDGRYKIDFYYATGTTVAQTLDSEYLRSYSAVLGFLGIDDAFDPRVLNGNEVAFGDFTLTLSDVSHNIEGFVFVTHQYSLKYKGVVDKLNFNPSFPGTLNSGKFWETFKDKPTVHSSFGDLIYQVRHYMMYYNLYGVYTIKSSQLF